MPRQPESVLVATPFITFVTMEKHWKGYKTHGSAMQAGFPDWYLTHPQYGPRWVETKVLTRGANGVLSSYVHFTDAQKRVFPQWLAHNIDIFIIAAEDLRGNRTALEEQYSLLFKPHNCYHYLNSFMRKLMYGGGRG